MAHDSEQSANDPAARVAVILASPGVVTRREPSTEPWPFDSFEPPDLTALYAVTDGIELADGTRILRRGELKVTTEWLRQEKSLGDWPADLIVVGERTDLVLVRDPDPSGARAGGGLLEAASDSLSSFRRAALGVLGYLEVRLGLGSMWDPVPEREARGAVARSDAAALARAIERPFYPGAERDLAHAALTLGVLRAASGDARGAIAAFERGVEARVRAARRGAERFEHAAAWRACAAASEQVGAHEVAEVCATRGAIR